MSGRIADIAFDPTDRSTWYVAVGSGGVWKTTNQGTTWKSVFDGQGSYSIGAVTVDPNNHTRSGWAPVKMSAAAMWATATACTRAWTAATPGKTWAWKDSEHIGMIAIDPRDSNVVFVAAQGPLWSGGGDRGLYQNHGWRRELEPDLSGGEFTGVSEVHMDPRNPDVMFASSTSA